MKRYKIGSNVRGRKRDGVQGFEAMGRRHDLNSQFTGDLCQPSQNAFQRRDVDSCLDFIDQ